MQPTTVITMLSVLCIYTVKRELIAVNFIGNVCSGNIEQATFLQVYVHSKSLQFQK